MGWGDGGRGLSNYKMGLVSVYSQGMCGVGGGGRGLSSTIYKGEIWKN